MLGLGYSSYRPLLYLLLIHAIPKSFALFASHPDPEFHRYTDGEIVREGPEGDQGDGAYLVGVSSSWLSFIEESKSYHVGTQWSTDFLSEAARATLEAPK